MQSVLETLQAGQLSLNQLLAVQTVQPPPSPALLPACLPWLPPAPPQDWAGQQAVLQQALQTLLPYQAGTAQTTALLLQSQVLCIFQ